MLRKNISTDTNGPVSLTSHSMWEIIGPRADPGPLTSGVTVYIEINDLYVQFGTSRGPLNVEHLGFDCKPAL